MTPARISLLVILLALSTALQAGSFELTPPRIGNVGGGSPFVAANDDGFLAVWHGRGEILSAPLDQEGRRLAPSAVGALNLPFGLNLGIGALVRIGRDYLLEMRDPSYYQASMFFVLGADGRSKGPWTAEISLERYHLAAGNPRGDRLLFVPRFPVERDAVILNDAGVLVRRFNFAQTRPLLHFTPVVSSDREFVISWRGEQGVHVQRIASDGEGSSLTTVAPAEATLWFATATDGENVLVIYEHRQSDPSTATKAVRVTRDGQAVPIAAFRTPAGWAVTTPYAIERLLALRWTGEYYVLIRPKPGTSGVLQAIAMATDGTLLDEEPRTVAEHVAEWTVANRGRHFYVAARREFPDRTSRVVGVTFQASSSITAVSENPLSIMSFDQTDARVTSDGTRFLAVWREVTDPARYDAFGLRGSIFSASGDTRTAIEFPQVTRVQTVDVAHAGGLYFVVWADFESVRALRVTPSGTVLDVEPLLIATGLPDVHGLKVVSNGTQLLVVWSTETRFEAASLTPSGAVGTPQQVRGGPPPRPGAELNIGCCSAATDGNDFLLMWTATEYYPGLPSSTILSRRTEAVRFDRDGRLTSAVPKIVADGVSGPLAWDGTRYAYVHWSGSTSATLRRLDRDGDATGEAVELRFPEWGVQPLDLQFIGGEFVLAFRTSPGLYVYRSQVARLGPAGELRRQAFGEPVRGYGDEALQLAVNAAGEIVAVVNELRPDPLGARTMRTAVYPMNDLLEQLPSPPSRRRAASR